MGNKWTPTEMGLHLAASLTGTANEILATIDVTGEGGYERLEEELKARYFCTPRTCQRQLASRRWEKGESLRTLGDDILRLTCRSHPELPPRVREEIASSFFLSSLNEENTRRFVLLSKPQNFHAHVTAAIEAQPLEGAKGLPRPVLAAQVDERHPTREQRREEPPRERFENRNRRTGTGTGQGRTGNNEERPPPKCWVCRGAHFQRFCPEVSKLKQSFANDRRETETNIPSNPAPAAAIETAREVPVQARETETEEN